MDNDGDLDVVLGKMSGNDEIWANNGTGYFGNSPLDTFNLESTYSIALGDVDGDGDLDVAACGFEVPGEIWLNDGTGDMGTAPFYSFGELCCPSIDLSDVDGDGDLDIFIASDNRFHQIWLNDGTGKYGDEAHWQGGIWESYNDGELGDVDGDGDLDLLFVADQNDPHEVWLNDGAGNFGDQAHDTFGTGYCNDLVLGDLDNDGDLDALVNRWLEERRQEVWLNNGSGDFGDAAYDNFINPDALNGPHKMALGDLDADGDLDLVIGRHDYQQEVWLNDGSGAFGPVVFEIINTGQADWNVALGDIDGDGDLDAVFGTVETFAGHYNSAWKNLNLPDVAIDKTVSPEIVRTGEWVTFTIDFSNQGVEPATDVQIGDNVPIKFTNTHVISAGVAITQINDNYSWLVQDLFPGQGGVITIAAQIQSDVAGTEEIDNSAYIDCNGSELNYGNNNSTATVIKVDFSIYLPLVIRQP